MAGDLTALQWAAELKNDPENLGYAPFVSANDYLNLMDMLNFVRDGVTAWPVNSVVGPSGTITGATNASPIVITSTAHGRATGDYVVVANVGGNTAANGTFKITVVDANTFSLNGSTGNGAYTSGGAWNWCVYGVREASVTTQEMLGAIDYRDLITNGTATAVTADQYGKLMLFSAILNDGTIALTNSDGTANNNLKTIKQAVNDTHGSQTAVTALSTRFGSRAEQLTGLTGTRDGVVATTADIQAALATGQA